VDIEADIRAAMVDVQPEIDRAVAEAMAELGVDAPHVHVTMPRPAPAPRPRPQRR
jgi:hypothetical protein